MKKALAIDVGGTKIYNAIINEKGEITGEIEKHHTPKTFAEIKALFKEIISKHVKMMQIVRLGQNILSVHQKVCHILLC